MLLFCCRSCSCLSICSERRYVSADGICSLAEFLPQYFIYEDKTQGQHLDFNVHHFARMNLLCCGRILQQHEVWEASHRCPFLKFCVQPFFLMTSFSLLLFYFHSNLLSNPYVCDCHLAWLGQWLKKTRVVSGNPRCQKPAFLKEIPIQDVATPDFTCDGELSLSLCTYSAKCFKLKHRFHIETLLVERPKRSQPETWNKWRVSLSAHVSRTDKSTTRVIER